MAEPLNLVRASDIKTERMPPEWSMSCPRCGRPCKPYGGFGTAMPTTGKYSCEGWAGEGKGCGVVWYGRPSTGVVTMGPRK